MSFVALVLLLASVGGPDPAPPDLTSNGFPVATPTPPPEPAPLWLVYYERGMKAMRLKEYATAIDEFNKAEHEISADRSAEEPALRAEINTQAGIAYVELAAVSSNQDQRQRRLNGARQHFGRARGIVLSLYGPDSLEYADATERLADARAALAETSKHKLQSYLGALAADTITNEDVPNLYMIALAIREQRLGEVHPDVMSYRRKILRQFRTWLRTCVALRRDVTDPKVQFACDPVIKAYKVQADELKKRDRALGKTAEVTTNGDL